MEGPSKICLGPLKIHMVVAAADAAAPDAAETNWKHKVMPDRGDLIIDPSLRLDFGNSKYDS